MARRNALNMISIENTSLKEYIHLLAKRVKDPPFVPEYDEFLLKVWTFFSLRVEAESFYKDNKHCALSPTGALPVSWHLVKKVFFRDQEPPEQMITLIAKTYYNDVYAILQNMRKVLNRVRQKVAIGRVQQVDSHCLRWLTRQPGRSAAEKGGSRQEILGIVRVENYNTLENRVLKDFLFRCLALSTMYLRQYDKQDCHGHVNIKAVVRFKNLCVSGLSSSEFENVADIREFPQPNYVLQQDRLYSKIWRAYSDIMKQEDVAEKLWGQKQDVDDLYDNCVRGIPLHCSPRAKFNTPLWMNVLDGKKEIFENPIWKNELLEYDIAEPNPAEANVLCDEVAIIDLTFPWDGRDELFYPSRHRNARPFIQNKHQPSLESGTRVSVSEIIRNRDATRLADYLRQVYGLFKKKRWVILVPDDWDAQWQENVLRARPLALSRDRVFLLWRSVAVALGQKAFGSFSVGDDLVIGDGYDGALYNATCIRYMKEEATGRILPQRSSVRLHGGERVSGERRFRLNCSCRDQSALFEVGDKHASRIIVGKLNRSNIAVSEQRACYVSGDEVMYEGVRLFLKNESQGLTSYFDELDGLSVIVTNAAEEVLVDSLVDYNEKSPGGVKVTKTLKDECWMLPESKEINLCLYEGNPGRHDNLKKYVAKFDEKTVERLPITFVADMMPGQGLATITVKADFLQRPVELDLTTMVDSDLTVAKIEEQLERHFPPIMPLVEASRELWLLVVPNVRECIKKRIALPNIIFTKGRDKYANIPLPSGISPIEKLRRENVFGNDPARRYPIASQKAEFEKLVTWLVSSFNSGGSVGPLAWMYQYDNDEVEFIREKFFRRYVMYHDVLRAEEISFCCNNMPDNDIRISKLLEEALKRVTWGNYSKNDLRLIYNLLQFHYSSIEPVDTDVCEKAMLALMKIYNQSDFPRYMDKGQTELAGYLLKSMLFLLHKRRYDAKFFLKSKDWVPDGDLNLDLETSTSARERNEMTRRIFCDYVRGCGSLKNFPTN